MMERSSMLWASNSGISAHAHDGNEAEKAPTNRHLITSVELSVNGDLTATPSSILCSVFALEWAMIPRT
jgi:hypothetical protein